MNNRRRALAEIQLWARQGLIILAMCFLIGEIIFRLPWVPGLLSYEFDENLGWRLSPAQRGCLFMGNLSYLSKPININGEGYRNGALDWKAPMVLCLGSSEALGTGVADDSTWTARLSVLLQPGLPGGVAINAGGPGYGPYHQLIRLEQFMRLKKPALVIARVSLGDRNFMPPSPTELAELKAKSKRNLSIRSISHFLPFLFNKMQAQVLAIQQIFRGTDHTQAYGAEPEMAESGTKMWEKQNGYWKGMGADCARQNIPLVFLVDDPLDTEAGRTLEDSLRNEFRSASFQILRLDGGLFRLNGNSPDEKRMDYKKRFTLTNDPHANEMKHAILAEFLANHVKWNVAYPNP
jgi:hypothetical protein